MKRALWVLFCASFLLSACRTRLESSLLSTPIPTTRVTTLPPVVPPEYDILHLSAAELWDRLQAGEAITVVDARDLSSYRVEHIAEAISMPEAELARRVGELPRDRLLVFYCA